MVKRASAPGKTTENVAKCRCNLGEEQVDKRKIQERETLSNLGLIVKLPAVGFMHATYCTLWMSFCVSLVLQYLKWQ